MNKRNSQKSTQIKAYPFIFGFNKKKIRIDPRTSELALSRIIIDKLNVGQNYTIQGFFDNNRNFLALKEFLHQVKNDLLLQDSTYELILSGMTPKSSKKIH